MIRLVRHILARGRALALGLALGVAALVAPGAPARAQPALPLPDTGTGGFGAWIDNELNPILGTFMQKGAAAGGDLGGNYPNPAVLKLNGVAILGGAPAAGNVLVATSPTAAQWQSPSAACAAATIAALGCVEGDNATLTLNGSGVIALNLANANTWTATQTIKPPSGTAAQGLVVISTGPSSGAASGSFNFNEVDADNPGYVTGSTTLDPFGLFPAISGLRLNFTSNAPTINEGLTVATLNSGNAGNLVGIAGTTYTNTGTTNGTAHWALIGFNNVGPAGVLTTQIAVEGESGGDTGARITNRIGVSANSQSLVHASGVEAAFAVDASNSSWSASNVPWSNGLVFTSALYGNGPPLTPTGNAIYSADTFTTGCFACMANVTFANYLFSFPDFAMSGTGAAVFGAGVAALPATGTLEVTGPSYGQAVLSTNANGASGFDGFFASNVSATGALSAGVYESSNTSTRFGQTAGNWAILTSTGSSAGLIAGTFTSEPFILGSFNTERARIFADGCFAVGTTGDCGSSGILNLGTGLRIANAAASGHYLRGNGTNYVDSAIQSGDLPSGTATYTAAASWTPALTASTTPGTPAYSIQAGSYTETCPVGSTAGCTVNAWFNITLSNWTGSPSGNVSITGLPVTSGSTANDKGQCQVSVYIGASGTLPIAANIAPGTTSIVLFAQQGVSLLSATNAGTSPIIQGFCTFHS